MLPSATDLRYFLEVAKTQNLSRAAVRLGITQPALTQAMKKLEAAVGHPLLIRSRVGVRLTRAGDRIASHAGRLFEAWDAIQTATRMDEVEIKGRFRVGCHPAVGGYALPKFFRDLSAEAPALEIQLVHDLSRRITEAVIDFRVDLGFVVNPVAHPDLVLKKLGTDVVTVFEAAKGRQGSDLFADPDLLQTQSILKRLKAAALGVRHVVPCSSLEVIRAIVASGGGFGVLPSRVATSGGDARVRPVAARVPSVHDEIYLVYRADTLTTRAAKALVAVASRALADDAT
jgi:DNA-binding transcriptional LysR family regulator